MGSHDAARARLLVAVEAAADELVRLALTAESEAVRLLAIAEPKQAEVITMEAIDRETASKPNKASNLARRFRRRSPLAHEC